MLCRKLTLVGVGLLGGSLGMAARHRRLAQTVVGCVRRAASIEEARRRGAVDHATLDLADAVRDADWVVLCTPIGDMADLAARMRPALQPGALITDVGSVKTSVVGAVEPVALAADARFVGSHPMAGAEKTGVAHARADLFEGAACVVTPTPKTDPEAIDRVTELWEAVGARTLQLTPDVHDELVGRSSHLPHLLAAALVNCVLASGHDPAQVALCGTGFRDSTRIASGAPGMWRDITLANREHLLQALNDLGGEVRRLTRALEGGDAEAILDFLRRAKEQRDLWLESAPSVPDE